MKTAIKDYVQTVRILGVCGDINFLDYGGTLVLENQGQAEGWHFEPDPENEKSGWLNQFPLDRRKLATDADGKSYYVPFSFDATWPHPASEYGEWYDDDIKSACDSCGITVQQFYDAVCSEDPMARASAYDVIGSYWGFHELSAGDERTISLPEYRRRLSLPAYRARKRGITVYV